MKFKNYLESIAGIEIYPMMSLFIFFVFFALLIFYVFKADKKHLTELQNIPFDNEENDKH